MEDKPMNCDNVKERMVDWLGNQLPEADRVSLESHLNQCPECQEEMNAVRQTWDKLEQLPVPQPTENLRVQFYAMLETFQEAEKMRYNRSLPGIWQRLQRQWKPQLAYRLAYSLLLLGVGIGLGYWLSAKQPQAVAYEQQIDTLSSRVQEMRQLMLLSLLENPSATERLRAVGYTSEISQVDEKVIGALLSTLNSDPNENVRLVTLEALARLADDPRVREGLVRSIARQESPLVQVALADVMVKLQEKRSLEPLRQLLRQDNLNDLVKTKIEQTIKTLS